MHNHSNNSEMGNRGCLICGLFTLLDFDRKIKLTHVKWCIFFLFISLRLTFPSPKLPRFGWYKYDFFSIHLVFFIKISSILFSYGETYKHINVCVMHGSMLINISWFWCLYVIYLHCKRFLLGFCVTQILGYYYYSSAFAYFEFLFHFILFFIFFIHFRRHSSE